MINNYVLRHFLKFADVRRSNIHDVRKMCLGMCLCVLVCFGKFYAFIFVENNVIGS